AGVNTPETSRGQYARPMLRHFGDGRARSRCFSRIRACRRWYEACCRRESPFCRRIAMRTQALVLAVVLLAPAGAGPGPGVSSSAAPYAPQSIDELVAPIALYPDQLLAQILL